MFFCPYVLLYLLFLCSYVLLAFSFVLLLVNTLSGFDFFILIFKF